MANPIPDIWPDDFGDEGEAETAPAGILRQQGINLGQKTKNAVLGKVYTRAVSGDTFEHTFNLYAPLLGYDRPVLSVTHGLPFYPARVAIDPILARTGGESGEVAQVASADELLALLRDVFRSDKGKALVRSLLAQSRPAVLTP